MNQSNQLDTARHKPNFAAEVTTRSFQNAIQRSLGDPARARRFTASITSAVTNNPNLQECTTSSIITSALLGEALDLSPSPQLGQYYLIPFSKNKKNENGYPIVIGKTKSGAKIYEKEIPEAQFILGYKGYIQLAIRSGQYQRLNVTEIKEGELNYYNPLTEELQVNLIQDFALRDETETIGYFASFRYINGFEKSIYWSKDQMLSHADNFSKAFNLTDYNRLLNGQIPQKDMWKYSSFWYKNFDDMAKKTMLRQLISKWGIMSIEMQQAFENDSFDNSMLQEKIIEKKVELTSKSEVIETDDGIDIIPRQVSLDDV